MTEPETLSLEYHHPVEKWLGRRPVRWLLGRLSRPGADGTPLEHISKELNIHIESEDVDTFSGALTEKAGRILKPGDQMELAGAAAEVLEVKGSRAVRIRVTLTESS